MQNDETIIQEKADTSTAEVVYYRYVYTLYTGADEHLVYETTNPVNWCQQNAVINQTMLSLVRDGCPLASWIIDFIFT